ncbi:MAG: response regulator [Eubacterium sp.]|nr:response regulator [Eubacterium sp.]
MRRKTTHFLTASFVLASIFCMIVFIVQTMWMNQMGAGAIKEIGVIYMSGMSKQIAAHFGTTIELRLSQVESLVDAVSPARKRDYSAMRLELAYYARSKGFEYLAFYTDEGDFQIIYGPKVVPEVPQALHRSVMGGKDNVSAGQDEHGERVVLIGVPAAYDIGEGRKSAALVAGLPADYLDDALAVNVDSSMVDYSIIRTDGTVIMQNADVAKSNYFDKADWEDEYVSRLRESMENGEDYSGEIKADGKRWNLYCTALPASEWHLLLHMPYSTLDRTVERLANRWSFCSVSGCMLVLGALLLVFAGYYRLTRKQMYELNKAYQSAEKERHTAERASRAKSEFLSNMSHDIRTPMNGIMGMTMVAMNSLDDAVRIRLCLKRISVSSRHLLGLINDMLDMAKIENGGFSLNMEPLSLREVMHNIMTVIQPQVQEKNQKFNIYVQNIQYENVCTDRVRLSQILLNIIGNCVKFTPKDGMIQVFLSEELSPRGNAYTRSCLHIKDNGVGMTQEFQEKIFEAFTREDNERVEKNEGAGMGMAITKYIVDAMGGMIRVQSEPGAGSDFYITIDMEKVPQQDQELLLPQRDVLVIDDDEMSCQAAESTLRSIGLRAECMQDMESALKRLEECRSSGESPIVLIDWDIQGQDGIQEVSKIRGRFGKQLTLILLSDGDWDELEEKAVQAGVDGFVAKPLFRSGLYYGLRTFAETKPQELENTQEDDMDFTGRRILFAEDNDLNWEIGEAMLSELGLELDRAENGKICLEKFEQSDAGWYDLILMDLRMPVMTGYEAAAAIRALTRDDAAEIPIIAVSADAFEDDRKKSAACGMNAHTVKPYDLMELIQLMNQHMHR